MTKYKSGFSFLYKFPGSWIVYRYFLKPLFNLLVKIDPMYKYYSFGLITHMNCDFIKDPEFIKAWNARLKQVPEWTEGKWLSHVNQWAVHHARNIKGDFVECGVYKGSLAMFNMTYLDFNKLKGRKYYLFDTFTGPAKEFSTKEEYEGLKECYPD